MSAALCQFGGHVSWLCAAFAIPVWVVVGCPMPVWWASLLDFCNFRKSRLRRCQFPYASLAGKSPGFLQLLQLRVESLSGGQVSWVSATFAAIQG
jgi:hypothetical protein